jgi:hypothetical protein
VTTFKNLVDQVALNLQGYTYDQAQMTFLTTGIDTDDTALTVDDGANVSRGIVEIDEELVWVQNVDRNAGTATIAPWGRGYMSSTAATHAMGARVTDNPVFPRQQIKLNINQVINDLYPDLYVIGTTEITNIAARSTYEVPAAAQEVTTVRWQTIGPSKFWQPIKRYAFNPRADTTEFPSGKSVDIWDRIVPGRPMKVDYIKAATTLANDSDDVSTVTGLGNYIEPVLIYGTCYRMAGNLDTPRLQTRAVETSQRAAYVETGAATDVAKYFYALYQEARTHARDRFLKDNPTVLHMTRY